MRYASNILGTYRVLHPIGEGGMGIVLLAEHVMLGRRVAIKVLRPEFSMRPDVVARFFNEAKAATSIADPGIVQVFDFGFDDRNNAFIVMELLEGEALDRRLARLGQLAPFDALRIVRQVAGTLAAAHARGVIHRDLKPENVFLVRDPLVSGGERAKLLDFGIAKLTESVGGAVTRTQVVIGTPHYMSPEQCRSSNTVDERSDIYSLGCVLFDLLAGAPPFSGEGGELYVKHLTEPAPLVSTRAGGITLELDALVARCLAKDPDERVATATQLVAEIDVLLSRDPAVQATRHIVVPVRPAPTTLSSSAIATPVPQPGRSRGIGVAVGMLGLAIAIAGVAWREMDTVDASVHAAATIDAPPSPMALEVAPMRSPIDATLVDETLVDVTDVFGAAIATMHDEVPPRPLRRRVKPRPRRATKPNPEPPPSQPQPPPPRPRSIEPADIDGDGIPDRR